MSVQVDPLPPVPQHTPPLDGPGPGDITRKTPFSVTWMSWFLQLKLKVDTINGLLVNLASVTGTGLLAKIGTASWIVRTLTGTANKIDVTYGDGVSGNPTVTISNTYVGQTSITTLGTLTSGTWNATAIGATYGGTGFTTYAAGDMIIASAINTLSKIAAGTNGYVWTMVSGLPAWTASSSVTTLAAIGAVPNANAATIAGVTLNLEPASASFGGVVTTGTQTFAGAKTFTSDVLINKSAVAGGLLISTTAGTSADIRWQTAGVDRWIWRKNTDAESGLDAGSNLELLSRTDAGALLHIVCTIPRNTAIVNWKYLPTFAYVPLETYNCAIAGGAADALTATLTNVPSFFNRSHFYIEAAYVNATATPTLALNGGGALTIKKKGSVALATGDISGAGHVLQLVYSITGTNHYELLNPASSAGSTPTGTGFTHITAGVQDAAASYPADSEVNFTDITTSNSGTTKHGYLKKLSNTPTEFMNGQGAWAVPAGAASLYITPAFASVKSLLHCDGTNGSTTITDQIAGNTWTATAATISTAQSVFGGASLKFTGASNSRISAPTSSNFNPGTSDWSFEARIYPLGAHEANARVLQTKSGDVYTGIEVSITSGQQMALYLSSNGSSYDILSSANIGTMIASQWNAVIIQRKGGSIGVWINGVPVFYTAISPSASIYYNAADTVGIGGQSGTSRSMNAHFDEIRFTHAAVVSVVNYPTSAFPDS